SASIRDLKNRIVREINYGIDDTGIRAGVIGEVGVSTPMHPDEAKSVRAAAEAHIETKAPVNIHVSIPVREKEGLDVLDVLTKEGVDLRSVTLSHIDMS